MSQSDAAIINIIDIKSKARERSTNIVKKWINENNQIERNRIIDELENKNNRGVKYIVKETGGKLDIGSKSIRKTTSNLRPIKILKRHR